MEKRKLRYISPFRYPGGKNWFLPIARKYLLRKCKLSSVLIEPFAGGAGVSLTAVNEGLVTKALFAEIDNGVASAWETILNGHAGWLANEVRLFKMSRKRVEVLLSQTPSTVHERAFQCILHNRTARGGVLTKGAGLLRTGENGKGLRSRWYPGSLAERIETISNLREFLSFSSDGFKLIRDHTQDPNAVFFVDPPYTKAARRLYTHWDIDHERLFKTLSRVQGEVLMTYDDTAEVRRWAKECGFKVRRLSMKTTHHETKRELMISREFDWMD